MYTSGHPRGANRTAIPAITSTAPTTGSARRVIDRTRSAIALGAFVLLGPVALLSRLLSDPLRTRPPADTAFQPWAKENETVSAAQRQG